MSYQRHDGVWVPSNFTGTKGCSGCGRELPITEEFFGKKWGTRDGLKTQCKECCARKEHDRRVANPDTYRFRDRMYNAYGRRRPQRREEVRAMERAREARRRQDPNYRAQQRAWKAASRERKRALLAQAKAAA